MKLVLIGCALLLASAPARAQFVVSGIEEGSLCQHENGLGTMVDDVNDITGKDFSLGSLVDSQGRCTMYRIFDPFHDELYGPAPTFEELAEQAETNSPSGNLLDQASRQWGQWEIEDHLGLRMGYVALNGETQTYLYFDRYGHLKHLAGHVERENGEPSDQWVLYNVTGLQVGVIYAADPPRPYRWDERMVAHYPFLFDYPYGN